MNARMPEESRWQPVQTPAGTFDAWWTGPEDASRAIILLQEVFGVNRSMRKLGDWLGSLGYLVAVPDLYWRLEPHIELGYSDEDIQKALGYRDRLDEAAAIQDIAATCTHVRGAADLRGIHILGLCLGGKLAAAAAAEVEVTSSVVFYGVGIEKNLGVLSRLKCPVQMHFGDRDRYVSAESLASIKGAPHSQPVEVHVYEGVDHGFFNPTRAQADDGAAAAAWNRARSFIEAG
jgi:carboxymethylenebutenolidase